MKVSLLRAAFRAQQAGLERTFIKSETVGCQEAWLKACALRRARLGAAIGEQPS